MITKSGKVWNCQKFISRKILFFFFFRVVASGAAPYWELFKPEGADHQDVLEEHRMLIDDLGIKVHFWYFKYWYFTLLILHTALCSRNFRNVKLRLDFVEIWLFFRHSDFTLNHSMANSNGPKMLFLVILEVLNFDF